MRSRSRRRTSRGSQARRAARKARPFGRESHTGVSTESAFKHGDLVTQDENLHALVPTAHGQQPQRGKRVRDGQIGQAKKHSGSSCPTRFRLPGDRSSRTPREALAES
ncbi:hypothetical protein GCM10022224_031280 [Nonomuraea antimicrobica]|uniref:Uncharacterized protein n=1 Tax=Nonomuraea antimicrobica TaxID=561173 RepID=A0ABP7BP40_9ACTN